MKIRLITKKKESLLQQNTAKLMPIGARCSSEVPSVVAPVTAAVVVVLLVVAPSLAERDYTISST